MLVRLLFVCGLLFVVPNFAYSFYGCAFIKKKGLAYKDIKVKAGGVIIPKGVILPVINKSVKSYVRVKYQGEEYSVKRSKVKIGRSKYCSIDYKCFKLTRGSKLYKYPKFSSAKIKTHKKDDELNWSGQRSLKHKGKKRKWYQVISDGDYGWIPAYKGTLSSGACAKDSEQRNFLVEADYGNMMSVDSDAYSYLITDVPDPSSVSCLQNPLVRSINPGSGHRVGVNGVYHFNSWLSVRGGAHFETLTYQVDLLDNPHPDPGNTSCALVSTDISSLSSRSISITENNMVFPLGLIYRMKLAENHHILLSAHFNSVYNIEQDQALEFYTGQTLSKQTLNTFTIGVDTFRTNSDFELRYIYDYPIDQKDSFGISIFAKKISTAMSFGLGVVL